MSSTESDTGFPIVNDPEWILLCRCVVDYVAQVPTQLSDRVDWPRLLHLAHRHRIQPLLAVQLDHESNRNPDSSHTLDALTAFRRINTMRTLQLAAVQTELLAVLRNAGIAAYVLKGLPLAARFYRELVDRHAGDIDLLLADPLQLQNVDKLMRGLGYQAFGALVVDESQSRLQRKLNAVKKELVYQSPCQTFLVEVHWPNPKVPVFTAELVTAYVSEQVQVDCLGESIAMPPDDVLLEYLLWHGARSKWFRLKWLVDVYLLIKQTPVSKEFLGKSAAADSVPAMLGANLMRELFGLPLAVPLTAKSRFSRFVTYRYLRNNSEAPRALDKVLDIPLLLVLQQGRVWRRYVFMVMARRLLRRIA